MTQEPTSAPASPDASEHGTPRVSAVIATRHRPELLRRALDSILSSEYEGHIECVVVFDQCEPDLSLEIDEGNRSVVVTTNRRALGLAGARNTGLDLATGFYVAFCDDDDEWLPGKVSKQTAALQADPRARFAVTGISIRFKGDDHDRVPDPAKLTRAGFLRDRMTEVHPSSFLTEREWFLEHVGYVDERLPGSYAEDYDVLLRTVDATRIAVVPEPLTRIWWHASSFFFEKWKMIDSALDHLVAKHPDFATEPVGLARITGQQAFALAALRDSRAWAKTRETLRLNARERRAYLAVAVRLRIVKAEWALAAAHRFGKGI